MKRRINEWSELVELLKKGASIPLRLRRRRHGPVCRVSLKFSIADRLYGPFGRGRGNNRPVWRLKQNIISGSASDASDPSTCSAAAAHV
jgi:hypothetical protein